MFSGTEVGCYCSDHRAEDGRDGGCFCFREMAVMEELAYGEDDEGGRKTDGESEGNEGLPVYVTGAVQVAFQVSGPTIPSTDRFFSRWNWVHMVAD